MDSAAHLDIDDGTRDRLAVSAVLYAAGRRTYVTGCVADVLDANAGRFGLAARTRRLLIRLDGGMSTLGDPYIDVPVWRKTADRLRAAGHDHTHGLDGDPADLRTFMFCAFRHDMHSLNHAPMRLGLLDDRTVLDASWRDMAARDLYEVGLAPPCAPEPSMQHLEPTETRSGGTWDHVYLRLVQ